MVDWTQFSPTLLPFDGAKSRLLLALTATAIALPSAGRASDANALEVFAECQKIYLAAADSKVSAQLKQSYRADAALLGRALDGYENEHGQTVLAETSIAEKSELSAQTVEECDQILGIAR